MANDLQQRIEIVFGKQLEKMAKDEHDIIIELLKTPTCCMAASTCSNNKVDGNTARILKGMKIACEKHARMIVMLEEGQAFVHGRDVLETIKGIQAERARAEAKEKQVAKELRDDLRAYLADSTGTGVEAVTEADIDEMMTKIKPADVERMKTIIRGDEKRPYAAPSNTRQVAQNGGDGFGRGNVTIIRANKPKVAARA